LTVVEILSRTAQYLQGKGLENPRLNAEVMLGHVLDLQRVDLYLNHDRPLKEPELSAFRDLVRRRIAGWPLQYLTGRTEFLSLDFQLTPAVLIPRPETEILVETVLNQLRSWDSPVRIADVGTGSGIVAISLAVHLPRARLWATDRSPDALQLARVNAVRHGVNDRIDFLQGDLLEPLQGQEGSLTAVVSNPPYVRSAEMRELPPEIREHEPPLALDGGADGLAVIRRLVAQAPRFLVVGGHMALEVGAGQAPTVSQLMRNTGMLAEPRLVRDYHGVERVVMAQRSANR
jgi:release factor glutamine methyltransferase